MPSLDDMQRGEPSIRAMHSIEEYARHRGHADLLRQQIDGATGYSRGSAPFDDASWLAPEMRRRIPDGPPV